MPRGRFQQAWPSLTKTTQDSVHVWRTSQPRFSHKTVATYKRGASTFLCRYYHFSATTLTMAYDPDYDPYDPYVSRPISRAVSRQRSIGYAPTYPYSDRSSISDYNPAYHMYPTSAIVPESRRLTGGGYDDSYFGAQRIAYSLSRVPSSTRSRRQSTVSFANWPSVGVKPVKFKRKGSFSGGIGLQEAQQRIKLSNHDSYTFHDLHSDSRRKIHLKIKWTGYSSLTYEIPLGGYDGRVDLGSLARRISRACSHYLQANVIPVPWDRVILHHLEEVSYGVWQPMLSMR